MKTYDEIVDNVIEATALHRRRVKHAQRIAATSAMCLACVFGLSVYLNLEPQNTLPEFSETETQTTMQTEAGTGVQTESVETTVSGTAHTDLPEPIESQMTGVQTSVTNAGSGETAVTVETSAESRNSSEATATLVTETVPPLVTGTTVETVYTNTTNDRTETTRSSSVATVHSSTTRATPYIPEIYNTDPTDPTNDLTAIPPDMGEGTVLFTSTESEETTTTTTTSTAVPANAACMAASGRLAGGAFNLARSCEEGEWLAWTERKETGTVSFPPQSS